MSLFTSPGDRVKIRPSTPLSSDVNRLITKLSNSRHFAQLHSILKAIYQAESLEGGAQDMKENFKLILLGLGREYVVDEVWMGRDCGTQEVQGAGRVETSKRGGSPGRNEKPRERLSRAATQRTVSPSSSQLFSLRARTEDELYSLVTST